jgi:hypothetical protein
MKYIFILILIQILISCNENRNSQEIKNEINVLLSEKEYENAYNDIVFLIEKDSANGELFYLKAIAETNQNKDKEALISLQKSIQLLPNFSKSFIERAKLKFRLGDYIGCVSDCDRAKIIEKNNYEIYKIEALAYEKLDDISNAINCYETSIKYNSTDGEIFYNLAVMQIKNRFFNKACPNLTLAGEKGCLKAYELIKSYCNNISNLEINSDTLISNVLKNYPGKFKITFPNGWSVDEITNKSNSVFIVNANKDGNRIDITEFDYILFDIDNKMKSSWEMDKEYYISKWMGKYTDFICHKFDKKKYNDTEVLIVTCSFSFFSSNLNQVVYAGQTQAYIFNHRTRKVYSIICSGEIKTVIKDSNMFSDIISTFKLL